ncbi:MAG: lytic transglycosylase domain-containing protein [Saprospiraceae bacterium]|nr:lytic transglycosylase domain-containing protein [Saprospiraceae bacterium]
MKGLPIVTTLQVVLFVLQSPDCLFAYAGAAQQMDLRQILGNEAALETCATKSQVPFEVQDWSKVSFLLKEYATLGHKVRRAMEKRMSDYLPQIAGALKENGLPEALQYLPLAESRLFPEIGSPAGAKGIWQIMPATGRNYGLVINTVTDERIDPEKSTQAAIQLLTKLYEEFGDWALVIAAYNCGPSRVRRAILKSDCDNYWDIDHLLPSQTRAYVPAFIAAACYAGHRHLKAEAYETPFEAPAYAAIQANFWLQPVGALMSAKNILSV